MSLAPGTRIGPYEIVSMVGAGGMGEVYRARDSRLQRDVALKILPQGFASDPDRLARFEREARTLAAVSHPHIAAIHGFEESNGTRALVLELVDGETLADRIARGAIPVEEALPIARQIAEALEAAHEQGIIHRDLKPANVKITPLGMVKVLDFGLAKLADASDGGTPRSAPLAPTITSPALLTHAGMLLGTAAYMAPEQAIVPGQPAIVFTVFRGTLDEARLAVLDLATRKWTLLMDRPGHAPTVTPTGELLYLRGPVLMMASFDIARRVITGPAEAVLTGVDFNNGGAGHYAVSHTGVLTYTSDFDRIPQTTVQWATRKGDVQHTGVPDGAYSQPAVSPDGNRLALVIRERSYGSRVAVWDFTRGSFTAQLRGDGPRENPVWSADGMSLFFSYRPQGVGSVGRLFRQRTDGTGGPEPLSADVPAQTHGSSGLFPASLSPDGQRLFFAQLVAPLSGIGMFNLATSTSDLILNESAGDPQISPDGRWLAYAGAAGPQPAIYIRPYPDVNRIRWTVSTGRGLYPRWSQDGKELLYVNGSDVFSIPIAVGRDLVAGASQAILKSDSSILGFAVHPDNRRFLLLQQTKGDRATPHVVLNWLQAQKRTTGATQR